MINKIIRWLKEENEKADKRCEAFVTGIFDNCIRMPLLNAMVDKMKKAEHECRVNLFVYEVVPTTSTHETPIERQ